MKKESKSSCAFDIVKKWFETMGYQVLEKPSIQDNNADMYVVGNRKAVSVEIKLMVIKQNGNWECDPISVNQRNYDLCAVVLPGGNVFVEKMSDFLIHCSDAGYRGFNWMKL